MKSTNGSVGESIIKFLKNWWISIAFLVIFFVYPGVSSYVKDTKTQSLPITELVKKINAGEISSISVLDNSIISKAASTTYESRKEPGESIATILKSLGVTDEKLQSVSIDVTDPPAWRSYVSLISILLPIIFIGFMILFQFIKT